VVLKFKVWLVQPAPIHLWIGSHWLNVSVYFVGVEYTLPLKRQPSASDDSVTLPAMTNKHHRFVLARFC